MRRGDRRYRQQRLITYVIKVLAGLALVGVVFLMVCGALYLRDLARARKEIQEASGKNVETMEPSQEETSSFEETQNTEEPEYHFTVVVDAGHGGNDSGTNVTIDGELIEEKHITLDVAKKVKDLLEEQDMDIDVFMTRERDEYVSLDERTQISRESEADLFLSIHCNSFDGDTSVSGLECYYWENDDEGLDYASSIQKAVKEIEGLRVRGVRESNHKSNNYEVLRENDRPAVLIEMGFITNDEEREKLLDDEYQQLLAEKFVEGIVEILPEMAEAREKQAKESEPETSFLAED